MGRSYEDKPESMVPESITATATFIAGGILVTHIDQGVIGNEYTHLTEKINPLQNQVDTLTEAQPLLATVPGRSDLEYVLNNKRSELHALTETRSRHHAPVGMGAEMLTDAGLTVLATIAAVGIHRAIYRRRHAKPSKADSSLATS